MAANQVRTGRLDLTVKSVVEGEGGCQPPEPDHAIPAGLAGSSSGKRRMAKKVAGFLKLQVPAGSATPSPPIGPALGQRGINIMEFCKAFNAQSQEMEKGSPSRW